ncbi:Bgt-5295 [Blumeria graminis f. sp. tritici]|uniref:Vacuolar protein sorting-associated protein n=3 Tax=Blumeria graminis f. sp. tritici TaxID=62690 RepID=A0A9X9MIR2_BLUGR|nr:Bgt-5295 [Blumeria graminis f. sp. tritici]
MLEGLVASLLNRFLGMYIRNFDPKQLNVGIWSGDVKLRNLELRREALDQLKLPLNVTEGHLGQLTLRIPWSNLRGQPVQVYIEDVYVLAAPKEDAEWDEEEEEKRNQAIKMEKLDSAELLKERSQEGLSQEEQQKSQSFTESLVNKIVDNLQITVKNIHIRYEDSISAPGHPFAIGVTLQEFSAISTDGDWKPTYIQDSMGPTHKLATLGALAIYWNTDSNLLGAAALAEASESTTSFHGNILDKFQSMIVKEGASNMTGHQFILRPVNGKAKIEIDKTGKNDRPHMNASLIFDEIGLVLDDNQYRDALMMVDLFHYFICHQQYKRLKPKNCSPKENPRAWLKFAFHAVLTKIHDRNRRWSWEFLRERRDDRIRYIELFKQKKKQESFLKPEEVSELEKLEWKLDYEDLRFWRSLAKNQLKKENVGVKKPNHVKSQGWVAWVWGTKPEEEDPQASLTQEQRKELYEAIDWDEKTALAESVELPKETVKMQISASLNTGSFTLKRNPHGNTIEVLSLYFDGFRASFLQRPESFLADLSLEGLRVNDGTTPGSLFTQIVRVKDALDHGSQISQNDVDKDSHNIYEPFFKIRFEKNPLDGESDMALTGKLKPLEIIWNPQFLVGIIEFFRPPERHMESIGALMETAGATVESLRRQTRAGLEFALEEHKTLNTILDLQAPLVIIPESITEENTVCLILDAGHISVNSQLVDKDTLKQVQEKQQHSYTDEDYQQLESLMYDKFLVKLSSTQLLIGPSIEETKAQLDKRDPTKSMHIVEKINIDFLVETSIIPKAPNLAKVRLSGHLPLLHVTASDTKYKSLMKIIDVSIPNFDENQSSSNLSNNEKLIQRSQNQDGFMKLTRQQDNSRHAVFQVPEQESIIIQARPDKNSSSKEASSNELSEDLQIQQHSFELKFEVDKLRGSLFRSDSEGNKQDQILVELLASNFAINLVVRPYDIRINTSLQSLMIDDYVENPPPEFKSIISSENTEPNDRDLVSLSIVIVKKESPDFLTKWEGVNTNIKVAISTINFVVTRATLLTLLDFILVTFADDSTSSIPPSGQVKEIEGGSTLVNTPNSMTSAGSIRIKIDLKSIRLILNNDGARLATLSLDSADVGIFIMDNTLQIRTKLADFTLLDDINQGAYKDFDQRKLITIQGDNLADFRYETFDPSIVDEYPGYDSSVYLRTGSIKVNFLREPFHEIIKFLVKFGKMQAIFNAARQAAANQASQIQQNASRMKFDINIKTPIVVFPRIFVADSSKRDVVTAYLGEIYAKNEFVPVDDNKDSIISMEMSAGIRNIRLTSDFYYSGGQAEELEIIDKVDLGFKLIYIEHTDATSRPELQIDGSMTDLNICITQTQLKFLLELANSIPSAFIVDGEIIEKDTINYIDQNSISKKKLNEPPEIIDDLGVDLGPELSFSINKWTKLDLNFRVHTIGLELVSANVDEPVEDREAASLSKFSLDKTNLRLQMMTDGSLQSELLIHSFTIQDSRAKTSNKFRKIMTSSNNDVQQFMASVTISGGQDRNVIIIIAVDNPRVIFALDYIFAILTFVNEGFEYDSTLMEDDASLIESADVSDDEYTQINKNNELEHIIDISKVKSTSSSSRKTPKEDTCSNIFFRVNVVDAQVILIANPLNLSSEAIVLGTKQILMSKQNVFTLQISQMGMFLCRMDSFESTRLRILDDFSLQVSLDNLQSNSTKIKIDIEPLVLRLSLRDILLALQIIKKASELSDEGYGKKKNPDSDLNSKKISSIDGESLNTRPTGKVAISSRKTPTGAANKTNLNNKNSATRMSPNNEELSATLEGMRLVLIGDLHELPIMDLSVKGFTVTVNDWSSNLRANANLDMFINVNNFSKSAWEPLLEPWQLKFYISRQINPNFMSIDLTSSKNLELTITSATISLAMKSVQFLTRKDDVLSKARRIDAPYTIKNYTGFDIIVWADLHGDEKSNKMSVKLKDGEDSPWQFEDWEKARENLSSEAENRAIGIRLDGSGFDAINKIPVNREGEYLHSLRPRKDQILHRLLVEITLGMDNIKYITFRSPLLIENKTLIPVEMGVFDEQNRHLLKIEKIPPGESRPAPVGAAFSKLLLIRPDQGFGYAWSSECLWWKDLLKRPTATITCKGERDKNTPPFYFQMHATIDRSNPLTSVYPYMKIRLSAPVELENHLPYDFKYRIYDKNARKDWVNFLRKGGLIPVHFVKLSHLLLMSIDMQDTPFKASEFSIITSNSQEDFRRESKIICRDEEDLPLNLCLHYFKIPDSGGALRITVYSPYVILNKTGLGIQIKSKSLLSKAKTAAGQKFLTDSNDTDRQKALPFMFTFSGDEQRNRAMLKIGESNWSKPQSFDAIGSVIDVVLSSTTKETEIHVGITIEAGEGKYKLTKIVTLAPRFVLKNRMMEEINFREPGSAQLMSLGPEALLPLHFLQKGTTKQLSLCYPGLNNQWSSPFNISDLGTTHVKLAKTGERQRLIRVEILMENATIFLHISLELKHWPFSIRNESDTEFLFYQANPNINEEDSDDRSSWHPIRYRLPPRSIMPYAWDYPAAKDKKLIFNADGKERHIRLTEIGNLIPMKITTSRNPHEKKKQKIIDLNVAADGPTQTLILSNFKASKSLYKQNPRSESTTSAAGGFEVKGQNTFVSFHAQLKLAGVGISLINAQLKELAYITMRDISLKYSESLLYQTITGSIKWIQVDNQLYGGIFPMIFYPSVVPKNNRETEPLPSVHIMVTRVKDDSYGVLYIKYATVLLQQMTLEIDEDFVYALLEFSKAPGAEWSEPSNVVLCDESLDIPEPTQDQSGNQIYFELLNIQPMQLDLSFVRTDRVNVEDKTSSRNPLMFFLNVLTMAIGNINDAPVRLNALIIENGRVSASVLVQRMSNHYSQEVLYQVHKILGSADFLGNPVGLFNNLSSGVADIFYEPYYGFIMADRPEDLGIGIAKGATSFLKKSVFGVSDSVSKFTGSIAKGLAEATMDKQFQDRRRMSRSRNRPKHALFGVTAGANSFVSSLASGVGGLARKPLEGAEQEGFAGFFKGVGKGALGFVTKPAIGIFDLASNVSEGIRNTTTVFDAEGLERVRLTRFIGSDGIVRPYSQREALGQFWLKQLDSGKYFNEQYIAHLELPREDVVVMLTYSRIMLIKSKKLTSEWDIPLKDIQTISKERTGLSLILRGELNGPFVPVTEESSRNFLYSKVGVAVEEFNQKYKAK